MKTCPRTLSLSKDSKMKLGILGGGQLGRMLLQAAANYDATTYVLENDASCPAAHLCHHFTLGNIQDFDAVYNFGKGLDAITIEIEAVNVDALEKLEAEGVKVYPTPSAIRTIKNKILQKQFYKENEIPTAPFVITQVQSDLLNHISFLPAVHKMAEGGYDGKGVQVITREKEIELGFNVPSVLEQKIKIAKEIALIVGMNAKGETIIYPPAEMIFDPVYNLLDYNIKNTQSITELEYFMKYKLLTSYKTDDFDLRRLFIGVTTIKGFAPFTNIFSEFETLEDAINCCIASSHIPLITGGLTNKYHNMFTFDGGFSNYPYLDKERMVHVSPSMWQEIHTKNAEPEK